MNEREKLIDRLRTLKEMDVPLEADRFVLIALTLEQRDLVIAALSSGEGER